MSLKCGIVGLPNVGKSTLFNAITNTSNAEASNYPFCTIEPNIGRVAVPDNRLNKLSVIAGSEKIIPNFLDIVDIAGLVAGASKGEGLGNQFLSNIRETDAILHVVRCFDDNHIIHTLETVDPVRDVEIIETELLLADYESLEKILLGLQKKKGDKTLLSKIEILEKIAKKLASGQFINKMELSNDELNIVKLYQFLTMKPMVYIANVDENSVGSDNKYVEELKKIAKNKNIQVLVVCSKIEEEISNFLYEEKIEFLQSIGATQSGLDKIIQHGYNLLNLITFFTVGPKECHAWNVYNGSIAPEAAGVIHTDFQKGFIKAETISYDDYVSYNGELGAKNAGKMRLEGKDYVTKDGDIFHFKFNV